jgi:hypothetical protein
MKIVFTSTTPIGYNVPFGELAVFDIEMDGNWAGGARMYQDGNFNKNIGFTSLQRKDRCVITFLNRFKNFLIQNANKI